MSAPDQWSWWRDALAGKAVDSEVGNPRSGFWKAPQDEPIAIWRDDDGTVCCERVRFGGGDRMSLDAIDQLYASASRYPLDEATYDAARAGDPPHGFKTRLTGKECQANVVWSLELGRKKLGAEPEPSELAGGAVHEPGTDAPQPPAEPVSEAPAAASVDPVPTGHTFDGEQTPDMVANAESSALAAQVKHWLTGIGGKPRNKAEADQLADYATKFGALSKKAEAARVQEKQPHLDAGREVDGRWKRPISNADAGRKRCLEIAQEWRDAENARRQAEAEAANREAAAAAERAAKQYDVPVTPPAPVQAEKVGGLGNIRTVAERERTVWSVDDPREYLRHLLSLNTDLPTELVEVLGKVASRRAVEAPGLSSKIERKAA